MSDAAPDTESVVAPARPCRSLRHNGMYIYTDARREEDDEFDTSVYTCLHTLKGIGPDDQLVNRPDCRNAGRSCYEPT